MKKTEQRQFELLIEDGQVPYWSYQDIMNRYAFAAKFIKDKIVLELGCGAGFGANYLAKRGSKLVVAGDISEEALGHCHRYSGKQGLEFVRLDATKLLFPADSFDVIIAFELIEHLKQYEDFLSECKRVLTDDGVLICSTPNKKITSPVFNKPLFKHHIKEFSLDELTSLVQSYFSNVSVYGQRFLTKRSKFEWQMRSMGGYFFERTLGNRMMARMVGSILFRRDYRAIRVEEDNIDEKLEITSEVRPYTSESQLTPGDIIVVATKSGQL